MSETGAVQNVYIYYEVYTIVMTTKNVRQNTTVNKNLTISIETLGRLLAVADHYGCDFPEALKRCVTAHWAATCKDSIDTMAPKV